MADGMKRWLVVTPQFSYTERVCADGGPTYDVADVIEIEAESKRDAIRLGVREMLRSYRFNYCRDQRRDDACPYTGVYAESFDLCELASEVTA